MKRIGLYIVIAMAIVGMLMGGCAQPAPPVEPPPVEPPPEAPAKPILVGFTADLTGAYATMGTVQRDTALLLIDEINKNGGIAGHPIEYIIYDTESDPVKGILATKRLITEDKVHILLGSTNTGVTIPAGLTAAEYGIAHIAQSGSPVLFAKLKEAGEEAFRWTFTIAVAKSDDLLSAWCKSIKLVGTKVAVVYPESAWGNAQRDGFRAYAPKFGLEVVVETSHTSDATVFGPQLAALKANPDVEVVFHVGVELSAGLFVAAMRDADIKLPVFLIVNAATTPTILNVDKIRNAYLTEPVPYVLGTGIDVWMTLPEGDPRRPVCTEWSAIHEKNFGRRIWGTFEGYSYNAMWLFKDVFGRLLKDKPDILDQDLATIRSEVRDYLETTKDFPGILLLTYGPEDHSGQVPGGGWLCGEFRYPPPCEYVPGTEGTTPPWLEK